MVLGKSWAIGVDVGSVVMVVVGVVEGNTLGSLSAIIWVVVFVAIFGGWTGWVRFGSVSSCDIVRVKMALVVIWLREQKLLCVVVIVMVVMIGGLGGDTDSGSHSLSSSADRGSRLVQDVLEYLAPGDLRVPCV